MTHPPPAAGWAGLDADGTLLNTWPRHLECLRRFLGAGPGSASVSDELLPAWRAAKRNGLRGAQALIALTAPGVVDPEAFTRHWLETIEDPELCELDTPFADAAAAVARLEAAGLEVVVVSARQDPRPLQRTLQGLEGISAIHTVAPGHGAGRRKAGALPQGDAPRFVIGDSEDDLLWAQTAGCPYFGVTTGARSAAFWREKHPRRTVSDTLSEAVESALRHATGDSGNAG